MRKIKLSLRVILTLFLSITFVFVTGCKAPEEETPTEPPTETPVAPTPGPVDPDAGTTLSYGAIADMVVDTTITDITPASSDISKLSHFKSVPNLPNGILLNSTTGVISGKPTGPWTPQTYTISGTTAAGTAISTTTTSFSVFATASDTSVDTTIPHNAGYEISEMIFFVGVPATPNLFSVQGTSPVSYEFVTNTARYAGIDVDGGTGTISGTPYNTLLRSAETISYRTQVNGTWVNRETVVYITILSGPPTITYTSAAYSFQKGATGNITGTLGGGTLPTLSISPALPGNFQFDQFTGAITGYSTVLQTPKSYTVTASNAAGSTTATFTIEITLPPPSAVTYTYPSRRYVQGAEAPPNAPIINDYGTPSAYSVSPSLPPGLSINASTGVITGTATTLQSDTTYTVTASNAAGSTDVTVGFSVVSPGTHILYSADGSQIKAYAADPVTGEPAYLGKVLTSPITSRLSFHPTLDCAFGISSSEVYALSVNKSDYGALSVINSLGGIATARNLALHSSGNLLYVTGGDSIYAYSVNASTCALSAIATTSAGVSGIVDGALSGDNLYVFTGGAHIKHFSINTGSGAVTGNATIEMSLHDNPPNIPQMHGAGLYLVAHGSHIYAYDDARAIETFTADGSGALTSTHVNFDSGTYYFGRPALDVANDRMYTPFNAASWSGLVYTVLNADGTSGNAGSVTGTDIITGFGVARTADIHVSDSGSYIYVSSEYMGARAYARMKINPSNGVLTKAGYGLPGAISGY